MPGRNRRGWGHSARPAAPCQTQWTANVRRSSELPYSGYSTVLRQTYAVDVRGGSGDASYNLGGGYTRTGNWLPNQANTSQSSPSVYGAMHYARGMIGVDIFGRHEQYDAPQVYNPAMAGTGLATYTRPVYQQVPFWGQTIGAHVSVTPTRWWQHTITIGLDRFGYDRHQTQPVLSTPGDTLLQVDDEEGIKNGSARKLVIGERRLVPVSRVGRYAAWSTRWRRRSNFARPYIARLIPLSRCTWPSTGPLLQRNRNTGRCRYGGHTSMVGPRGK